MQQVEVVIVKEKTMTNQKKVWKTPVLEDLNIIKTNSGTLNAPTEDSTYNPSGAPT